TAAQDRAGAREARLRVHVLEVGDAVLAGLHVPHVAGVTLRVGGTGVGVAARVEVAAGPGAGRGGAGAGLGGGEAGLAGREAGDVGVDLHAFRDGGEGNLAFDGIALRRTQHGHGPSRRVRGEDDGGPGENHDG